MINPATKELLDEREWLERMAYGLVRNQEEAKDVAQETYLTALKSPPPAGRPVRGWLARVATNVARMKYRGNTRRSLREESVAPPEANACSFEQLHSHQAAEAVTRAVQALAEPFRSALLLRFVDEMSIADVASKQGVPVGTAGWRISEGLKRLRRDLDNEANGDARSWLMALCPALAYPEVDLSETQAATAAATSGASNMIKFALLVAFLASTATATYSFSQRNDRSGAAARGTAVAPSDPSGSDAIAEARPNSVANVLENNRVVTGALSATSKDDTDSAAGGAPWGEFGPPIFEFPNGPITQPELLQGAMNILASCYGDLLHRQPELRGRAGKVHVDVDLVDDEEQGVVVVHTKHQVHPGTTVDSEFEECMRESSFVLESETSLAGVQGQARIAMVFPEDSQNAESKRTATRECVTDLQRRRPGLVIDGAVDDAQFAACMEQALGLAAHVPSNLPEEMKQCHEGNPSHESILDCYEANGAIVDRNRNAPIVRTRVHIE